MFKCQACGRKFKTGQRLGGHVANAHPKEGEPVVEGGAIVAGSPAKDLSYVLKTC